MKGEARLITERAGTRTGPASANYPKPPRAINGMVQTLNW